MTEKFRPYRHEPPKGFLGTAKFYLRMFLDLQFFTIYLDLRRILPSFSGRILDVGCGESPYRFLLSKQCMYQGIDIADSENFDYNNSEIARYNGEDIPYEDESYDGFICTEVLEHVYGYQKLINEIHRVLKKGGKGVVTVPWSARYHYIPHDYFRYTPSSLEKLFSSFSRLTILPRGNDIAAIASKVVVVWYRNLLIRKATDAPSFLAAVASTPLVLITMLIAHISLIVRCGSQDDPLGYTIIAEK